MISLLAFAQYMYDIEPHCFFTIQFMFVNQLLFIGAAEYYGRSGVCDASTGGYSCVPCPQCPKGFYRNASCVVADDGAIQGCVPCSTGTRCDGGFLLDTCDGDHDFSCKRVSLLACG